MTKFKAGDVAERNRAWPEGKGLPSGKLGVVSSVVGDIIYIKGYGSWAHLEETLRLVEQDDPLPPAPESVRYYTSPAKVNYLDIHIGTYGELCIAATSGRDTFYNYLDADAALQLAHDLNRMANEIKRKEKQQERKTTLSPAITHPYGE